MKTSTVELEIAKTLIEQHEIFHCSIEEAWNNHIHQGVRSAHHFEKIQPFVLGLLKEKLQQTHKSSNALEYRGVFVQHSQYVVALLKINNNEFLRVYQGGKCIYKHPQPNLLCSNISIILRRKLNIQRFNPQWRYIIHHEFIKLIHKKKINN